MPIRASSSSTAFRGGAAVSVGGAGLQPPDGSAPGARPTVSLGQKRIGRSAEIVRRKTPLLGFGPQDCPWDWLRSAGSTHNRFGPRDRLGLGSVCGDCPLDWVRSAGLPDIGFGRQDCPTMGSVRGIAPGAWVRSAGLPLGLGSVRGIALAWVRLADLPPGIGFGPQTCPRGLGSVRGLARQWVRSADRTRLGSLRPAPGRNRSGAAQQADGNIPAAERLQDGLAIRPGESGSAGRPSGPGSAQPSGRNTRCGEGFGEMASSVSLLSRSSPGVAVGESQ